MATKPIEVDVDTAIDIVERSRATHLDWAAWWRAHPADCTACDHLKNSAGDLDHHLTFIEGYDQVLATLRSITNAQTTPEENPMTHNDATAHNTPPTESAYDRALRELSNLRTDSGFVVGDVLARAVLDSGIVAPTEPDTRGESQP